MIYKGFKIITDKFLGFSLIDRKAQWCCSKLTEKELKIIIDNILKNGN